MKKLLLIALLPFNAFAGGTVDGVLTPTTDIEVNTPTTREADKNGFKAPLGLSEIGGMRLYCGTAAGDYQSNTEFTTITLPITTLQFDNTVQNGSYYCVVTTYDIDGREALYSDELPVHVVNTLGKPAKATATWK